jgi:D-alanyl-D-alanine carboxypeptidase/D-alanyl-D-alanine-endopeptidase (penicillin-binding protein 4)
MKIVVVFVLSFFFATILYSQEDLNSVQRAIQMFSSSSGLENAAISFQAIDLSTGEVIAEHNGKMMLPPASITKLFATASAFELLGSGYQPKTELYIDGEIDSLGTLHGNIWVRGGGDPTLGSRFFEKSGEERSFFDKWKKALLDLGINHVKGSVITDASAFGYNGAPEGWSWGDLGNYYGSGPSGIVLFDNTTYLQFKTGNRVGDSTELICMRPHVEGLRLRNEVTSSSYQRDNSYVYGAPFSFDRFIVGTLPINKESFEVKASIPDPELLIAQELQFELAQDISFEYFPKTVRLDFPRGFKPTYKDKKLIHTELGKTTQTIAYWTNMRSVNLFAEQLVCLMGYEKKGNGSTSSGINVLQSFWEGKISQGFVLADGSGLSRKNAISAEHFVELLKYMKTRPSFQDFKYTLPVTGESGTLSRVCRGQYASGRIAAKSGTMARIKAYSGYVSSSSGKEIAFALIVNNHTISNAQLVKKMERVFNVMAAY